MESPGIANRLLASLPRSDRQRLISRSQEVELVVGKVLCVAGARIAHAYFPISGIISALTPVDNHASLQVELVGTEGMIGLPLVLGVGVATLHENVQRAGVSIRLSAAVFRQELRSSRPLRATLGRYTYVLRAQLAETAACNSFHRLEARLARWLLTTLDRANSNEFYLTHELLGKMLGVRRVGITNAAGILQRQQLVRYTRGNITVLNRVGLEKVSCRCYQSARDTYDRILAA
jgi:CRP-like cAMP-binding protein